MRSEDRRLGGDEPRGHVSARRMKQAVGAPRQIAPRAVPHDHLGQRLPWGALEDRWHVQRLARGQVAGLEGGERACGERAPRGVQPEDAEIELRVPRCGSLEREERLHGRILVDGNRPDVLTEAHGRPRQLSGERAAPDPPAKQRQVSVPRLWMKVEQPREDHEDERVGNERCVRKAACSKKPHGPLERCFGDEQGVRCVLAIEIFGEVLVEWEVRDGAE